MLIVILLSREISITNVKSQEFENTTFEYLYLYEFRITQVLNT